jgi:hypothetical protein
MASAYDYERPRRGGGAFLAVLLALIVGGLLLGTFVHRARSGWAGRLAGMIAGRPLTVISAPDVVEKVQRLNRLETVVYSLDTVIEGKESSTLLPDALAGDRLLMIVHGQTIAGIDFSQMRPDGVQIHEGRDGRTITLSLPPSQVFLTNIDNAKTRVYERTTGLFVAADPNLESQTRQRAQTELQQAALQAGVLDMATRNGQETVRVMLEGLGFSKVEIR